jgi:hypothetical protein
MIGLLLKAGADKAVANDHGVSPLDLAKNIASYPVLQFLA